MSEARKMISQFIGGIQCVLGGLAWAFAFLIYANPLARDALVIASEEIYLYMFLLLVFGMFSILSGLLLVREEKGGS